MGSLFKTDIKPRGTISERVTHPALRETLGRLFARIPSGVWLVGGTALAGYYAEHRRSDDLDLFASDPDTFATAVHALRSLVKMGAVLTNEFRTPSYARALVTLRKYGFTADIVLDENLHAVGCAHPAGDGVRVADLGTILGMKMASLVSRASEKDLFDLEWLLAHPAFKDRGTDELIQAGSLVDAGLEAATLIISLRGAILREEACGFLPEGSRETTTAVKRRLETFRKRLLGMFLDAEKARPLSPPAEAIKRTLRDMKK